MGRLVEAHQAGERQEERLASAQLRQMLMGLQGQGRQA
jgi:hypothetical protein